MSLATRTLVAFILVVLIIVPIVVLQAVTASVPRVLCLMAAMIILLTMATYLSNARTTELFIAGAT